MRGNRIRNPSHPYCDLENLFSNAKPRDENICIKFHSSPFTKHGDNASRGTGVNGQRTDGRTTRKRNALHKNELIGILAITQ